MARQLLILRHAKSAWDTDAPTDFERPLSKRGQKDAPRMGRWLCQQGLFPDYVVSSPAERAKTTTLMVCKEMNFETQRVEWEPRIYEAPTGLLLDILGDCPSSAQRVLLVGHNPGLEALLLYLDPQISVPGDGKLLPTATLAHVQMPGDWVGLGPGSGHLLSITRPRSLAD